MPVSSAPVILLGGGRDHPLLPAGEKVPEGRMRGRPLPRRTRAQLKREAL
jgi:hypothetical protein